MFELLRSGDYPHYRVPRLLKNLTTKIVKIRLLLIGNTGQHGVYLFEHPKELRTSQFLEGRFSGKITLRLVIIPIIKDKDNLNY